MVHQGIGPILIGSLLSDHYEQLHNYKLTLKQLDHLLQNDAWPHYKKWMRDRKLPSCSMQFSLIRIGRESWQRYPEMASCYKAAVIKSMLYWIASFLHEHMRDDQADSVLRADVAYSMAQFHYVQDSNGPWLNSGRKQGLRNEPLSEFSQKGKTCCTTCFRACRAAASESDCGEHVHPPGRLVPPSLSHKIKALQLRLCALQLRASPLHGEDAGALERVSGWPCKGRQSKEVSWHKLSQEEKVEFDEAQAIELKNVLSSAAVRALTRSELQGIDPARVVNMRWALTRKSSGTAKARLVVLGFQQHNLTSVQTAAPTLSRSGRYALLAAASNKGFKMESGDVTSAFLQTVGSLEDEELFVRAPSELSALFGAEGGEEVILKLTKAFYGLVHAPRKWHESVVEALLLGGWTQTKADRCLFCMFDDQTHELIALAGMHVDDFLICGKEDHPKYIAAKAELQSKFKFGKWCEAEFDFAGCHLKQDSDGIYVDQEEYVNKWLEEVPLTREREKQSKSSLTAREVSQLRAVLGTLSWKASQTGPHHQAEVSLLLSGNGGHPHCREQASEGSEEGGLSVPVVSPVEQGLERHHNSGVGRCLSGQQAQEVQHDRIRCRVCATKHTGWGGRAHRSYILEVDQGTSGKSRQQRVGGAGHHGR